MADPRGGRQDRPLLARLLRHPELRRDRARHPDHDGGAVLGRRRHRPVHRRHRRWPPRACAPTAPTSRSGSGSPQMFGTPGDLKVAAFCSSEPDAGSDVGAMRTRATYDEATDEWVLNGTKTWATNGGIADIHVVTAVVDPELRARGQASFVVPPGTKGLSQGQKFAKHGIRASHTAEVVLDEVPGARALPARRQGEARRAARPGPGTGTPPGRGAARPAVDGDLRADPARGRRPGHRHRARGVRGGAGLRARTREQFGKPIIENQAIAFALADMATSIDAVAAAGLARGVDGEPGPALRARPRARCRSCSPARRPSG